MIRFYPMTEINASHADQIRTALERILDSGQYLLGKELESFEESFADFVGARYCVGVANGSDAITLGLRAMNIGPGDEVIVPAHTFIATILSVQAVGATPVPVDVDPETCNIDAMRVTEKITDRTKAMIPVHLYGRACPMSALCELAESHHLRILEDCAQAHGAYCDGRQVGTWGDMAAFSFYPGKNLGALGDAGAVVTNNESFAEEVRILRNYGSRAKYQHVLPGVNSRMDELQAAVLRMKLLDLPEVNRRRSNNAEFYLKNIDNPKILLPKESSGLDHVWHLFVVRCREREQLQRYLAKNGIETQIHYPVPPHKQPAFRHWNHLSFPVTEKLHEEVLSLPVHQCMSQNELIYVAEVCCEY